MTTVLITGGVGVIGSHRTEALLAEGDGVVVLGNLSTGRSQGLDTVGPTVADAVLELAAPATPG